MELYLLRYFLAVVETGSFTKAAIARLSEEQVTDALAFAARAASVTVSRPGADPPWARELA